MSDTWAHKLYQSLKHIAPWPHMWRCTPPLRHKPLDTDDDVEFWSDMRYLDELADAIITECRLARTETPDTYADDIGAPLLEACCIPVESAKFWEDFGPWPIDYAATLISLWKFDNELEQWMSGECAA